MSRLCLFVLIGCLNSHYVVSQVERQRLPIYQLFVQNDIIPLTMPDAPAEYMTVKFPSDAEVMEGNVLTPTQVKDAPWITWDRAYQNYDALYTVMMIAPDPPSGQRPYREWLHWLVVNVPGDRVEFGETIAEYIAARPGPFTGLHRYLFVLYKQPHKLEIDEPRTTKRSGANRANFSVSKFAEKYNLGSPVAGNLYKAEYDEYVPVVYQQLMMSGQSSTLGSSITVLTSILMQILALIK